jgi:hypothetical protein
MHILSSFLHINFATYQTQDILVLAQLSIHLKWQSNALASVGPSLLDFILLNLFWP